MIDTRTLLAMCTWLLAVVAMLCDTAHCAGAQKRNGAGAETGLPALYGRSLMQAVKGAGGGADLAARKKKWQQKKQQRLAEAKASGIDITLLPLQARSRLNYFCNSRYPISINNTEYANYKGLRFLVYSSNDDISAKLRTVGEASEYDC